MQQVLNQLLLCIFIYDFLIRIIIIQTAETMINSTINLWTEQEDDALKRLTQKTKIKDWHIISSRLRESCQNSTKTSKQCSLRYLKLLQERKRPKKDNEWSYQQMIQLKQLFTKHGLKWTFLTKYFPQRTQNSIKNRFYNSLRKTARKLMDYECKVLGASGKSPLTCQMLTIILELSHQLQKLAQTQKFNIPSDCMLLNVRRKVLDLGFDEKVQMSQQEMHNLVKCIRKLNSNLRCFGVYKTKKRKNWNLDFKRLQSVIKILIPQAYSSLNSTQQQIKPNDTQMQKQQQNIIENPQNNLKQIPIESSAMNQENYSPEEMLCWLNYQYMVQSYRNAQLYLTQYNNYINQLGKAKDNQIFQQKLCPRPQKHNEIIDAKIKIEQNQISHSGFNVKYQYMSPLIISGPPQYFERSQQVSRGKQVIQQNKETQIRKKIIQVLPLKVEQQE